MQNQTCTRCQEAITNPICPECLEQEVIAWLVDRNPYVIPYITGKGHEVWFNPGSACIFCHKDMSFCAHCYVKEIQNIIFKTDRELEREFTSFFNYQLEGIT